MPVPGARALPNQFADMMDSNTGTLVAWSKCDRLTEGEDGTVNDLNLIREELVHWISGTYAIFSMAGSALSWATQKSSRIA